MPKTLVKNGWRLTLLDILPLLDDNDVRLLRAIGALPPTPGSAAYDASYAKRELMHSMAIVALFKIQLRTDNAVVGGAPVQAMRDALIAGFARLEAAHPGDEPMTESQFDELIETMATAGTAAAPHNL